MSNKLLFPKVTLSYLISSIYLSMPLSISAALDGIVFLSVFRDTATREWNEITVERSEG